MNIQQTAEKLGVCPGTVYKRIARLRDNYPELFKKFTKVARDWDIDKESLAVLANMPDERRGKWKKVRIGD